MSDNELTGTSLEVLSFMASGIKKRSNSEYSDGRPGRINYGAEGEYRTVRLTVEANAYDMHDIAHLRDSINELFNGEFYIREKRIINAEVEYESPGQKTGELKLPDTQYVNGKQIYVGHVGSIEIEDTTLTNTFTVEMETVEIPYFESIYTTLELHDSGYDANKEKYGLVDNIDDEKVKYRFEPKLEEKFSSANQFEYGTLRLSDGEQVDNTLYVRSIDYISVLKGEKIKLKIDDASGTISNIRVLQYNSNNVIIDTSVFVYSIHGEIEFNAVGEKIKLLLSPQPSSDVPVTRSSIGETYSIKISLVRVSLSNSFVVHNAGNVKVEPESMYLNITLGLVVTDNVFRMKNITTGETFEWQKPVSGRNIYIRGMNISEGTANIHALRDTNRRFISLVPGDNEFEVSGGTFSQISFDFRYLYK